MQHTRRSIILTALLVILTALSCAKPDDRQVAGFLTHHEARLAVYRDAMKKTPLEKVRKKLWEDFTRELTDMEKEWEDKMSPRASDKQQKQFKALKRRCVGEGVKSFLY